MMVSNFFWDFRNRLQYGDIEAERKIAVKFKQTPLILVKTIYISNKEDINENYAKKRGQTLGSKKRQSALPHPSGGGLLL